MGGWAIRAAALTLACALAACGGTKQTASTSRDDGVRPSPTAPVSQNARSTYKVGKPYKIAGARYRPEERFTHRETGRASWYGPGFHGRKTANGERFDQRAMTAAHRTLQLPTIIRVTNIGNGKSVVLRVNDRGPYHGGRVLDVSEAAAEALDFKRLGTAQVRIDVMEGPSREVAALAQEGAPVKALEQVRLAAAVDARRPPPPRTIPPEPEVKLASIGAAVGGGEAIAVPDQAFVQAGAFSDLGNARKRAATAAGLGVVEIAPTYANGLRLYRVRLGPYADLPTAEGVLEELAARGVGDAHLVVIR